MTQTKTSMDTFSDFVKRSQGMLGLNPVAGPQLRHFWEAQEQILEEAEQFSKHWFERRHTATTTALEAAHKIAANAAVDPAKTVEALGEWQTHSVERIAEDFQEWVDMWSKCAGHIVSGEVEANEETLEEVAKEASARGKSKHSTPV